MHRWPSVRRRRRRVVVVEDDSRQDEADRLVREQLPGEKWSAGVRERAVQAHTDRRLREMRQHALSIEPRLFRTSRRTSLLFLPVVRELAVRRLRNREAIQCPQVKTMAAAIRSRRSNCQPQFVPNTVHRFRIG